jgi:molybdate transport system substrate-binding protein
MKSSRVLATIAAFLLLTSQAPAADIKVFVSTAAKSVLDQLGSDFEKTSGNKLDVSVGPAADLKQKIDQGAAFDIAILTAPLIDALAQAGRIDPASRATIARAGLGVSIGSGVAKPDVSTDDALKTTLLNAKSIGYNGVGASKAANEAMFSKLGISDAVRPKVKVLDVSAPIAVAKGEVEIGLGPISEILPVEGVQFVGAYPADVQSYLVFSAGLSSSTKETGAAKALIDFLRSPAAVPVIKTKGMEPG